MPKKSKENNRYKKLPVQACDCDFVKLLQFMIESDFICAVKRNTLPSVPVMKYNCNLDVHKGTMKVFWLKPSHMV
jgi:hypothetical protein